MSVRFPLRRMNLIRAFDEMLCGGDPGLTPVWAAFINQSGGGGQEKPPTFINHQLS